MHANASFRCKSWRIDRKKLHNRQNVETLVAWRNLEENKIAGRKSVSLDLRHRCNIPTKDKTVSVRSIINRLTVAVTMLFAINWHSAIADELPRDGMILWLDATDVDADGNPSNAPADGSAIENWRDRSGRGNHLAQDEPQRRPTYQTAAWDGRPAVRFHGDDLLDVPQFQGLAVGDRLFHVLIVIRAAENSAETQPRLLDLNSRDPNETEFPKRTGFWIGASKGRKQVRLGIQQGDEGEGLSDAWNDHPNLIETVYGGEQAFAIHLNGHRDQRALFNGTHFLGFKPNVTLALGQHFGKETSKETFFEGDIAEVLIYDRPLSATERYETGTYLAKKYALTTEFRPIPQFEKDVQPILAKHCHACHGDAPQEAELDLRNVAAMLRGGKAGPVIVRGFPDRSDMISMIEAEKMPPEGEERLSAAELRTLRDWVEADAPSTEKVNLTVKTANISQEQRQHWAYQKLVIHQPPQLASEYPATNDVDRFLLSKLEEKGLSFSPAADRATLIRRARIST